MAGDRPPSWLAWVLCWLWLGLLLATVAPTRVAVWLRVPSAAAAEP